MSSGRFREGDVAKSALSGSFVAVLSKAPSFDSAGGFADSECYFILSGGQVTLYSFVKDRSVSHWYLAEEIF